MFLTKTCRRTIFAKDSSILDLCEPAPPYPTWEGKKLFIYLSFFFFVLYGGTSGLHAHTHGHTWLGVVCCRWHVAIGCCTLLWYPVCLLVLANHRRRVVGCIANKLRCLLYSFWIFTNWWSQRHIWWNVLDKSLVTGVLELFPWLCRPSQDLSNLNVQFV